MEGLTQLGVGVLGCSYLVGLGLLVHISSNAISLFLDYLCLPRVHTCQPEQP